MKKTVMGVAAVALITVALPQTSHAWGFLNGNTTYVTPQRAGGDNRQSSHNIYNSKNTTVVNTSGSNDSGNHSSASGGGGWGWGWGWGWGGGGASSSAKSEANISGGGTNFGQMGNGGNSVGNANTTVGDNINTGHTYNGTDVINAREETTRQGIYSNREIELARINRR